MRGEAVKELSGSFRQKYDSLPWSEIARTRDNIIHRYFKVDPGKVWEVVTRDAPILKSEVTKILETINREEYLEYLKRYEAGELSSVDNLIQFGDLASEADVAMRAQDAPSALRSKVRCLRHRAAIVSEYPLKWREVARSRRLPVAA